MANAFGVRRPIREEANIRPRSVDVPESAQPYSADATWSFRRSRTLVSRSSPGRMSRPATSPPGWRRVPAAARRWWEGGRLDCTAWRMVEGLDGGWRAAPAAPAGTNPRRRTSVLPAFRISQLYPCQPPEQRSTKGGGRRSLPTQVCRSSPTRSKPTTEARSS